jgi:hypothetical protein
MHKTLYREGILFEKKPIFSDWSHQEDKCDISARYGTPTGDEIRSEPSRSQYEKKNKIGHLWEELEMILEGDKDFEIQERSNSILKMKAKRTESFNNSFVMGKIFGSILPVNCRIDLTVNNIRKENPQEDEIRYNFKIRAKNELYYIGKLILRRG